jgi:hypothetical protein
MFHTLTSVYRIALIHRKDIITITTIHTQDIITITTIHTPTEISPFEL